ncbi:MAG: hypothetical protein V3T84_07545 [Phycisphaerales bacterium]
MPHANSLANLRPPWQPGQSGNRKGRPNTGGSLIEYIHELGSESEPGVAKYPLEELEAIGADHRASHTKAMAAQLLVLARTPGFHEKSGKPYCAMLVEMILDRTVGKPVQSVMVQHTQSDDPEVLLAELRAAITRSPELLSILGDRLPAEALPVADVEAEAVDPV